MSTLTMNALMNSPHLEGGNVFGCVCSCTAVHVCTQCVKRTTDAIVEAGNTRVVVLFLDKLSLRKLYFSVLQVMLFSERQAVMGGDWTFVPFILTRSYNINGITTTCGWDYQPCHGSVNVCDRMWVKG